MPNELIVSIKADTSGLSSGLADATGQVTAGANAMAAAQANLAKATKELAWLEKVLAGEAVKSGTAMAALADELEANVAAAQAAVNACAAETGGMKAQTAATTETAAATKAAAAANRDFAVSGQVAALGAVR